MSTCNATKPGTCAREDSCQSTIDITLKNARAFEAHDVRLNGLALSGLQMMSGPGRLEFVARPAAKPGTRTSAAASRA